MKGKAVFKTDFYTFIELIFIICILGLVILIYFNKYKQNIKFKEKVITEFENQYSLTINIYEEMSNLIYQLNINNDEIKSIFKSARDAKTLDEKDLYRKKLYNRLLSKYKNIEKSNFRQLHFHEATGDSFLRFHRPKKFGDNLLKDRASVDFVNKNNKYISGFEEGKIFNGYRFVYPLELDNEFLGSVEISISMKTILSNIEKEIDQESEFLLKKSKIIEKVFEDELLNYVDWDICSSFMKDRFVSGDKNILKGISKKDKEKICKLLDKGINKSKSIEISIDFHNYLLIFLPIKNFDNKVVAYMISKISSRDLERDNNYFMIISSILVIFLLMLLLLVFRIKRLNHKLEELAIFDGLTHTYTRKEFLRQLDLEFERYKRVGIAFSLIMYDLDNFKKINDEYGHLEGDHVLKKTTEIVKRSIRKIDLIGRYGGEEFFILLPNTNINQAKIVAEKIRLEICSAEILKNGNVTASFGVIEVSTNFSSVKELIGKVDEALYKGKESGRNCVIITQ